MSLENELNEVITSCKNIVNCNYSVIQKNQNVNRTEAGEVKGNDSQITLENIAQDMSGILQNLRNHLELFKNKSDMNPGSKRNNAPLKSNSNASKTKKNNKPNNKPNNKQKCKAPLLNTRPMNKPAVPLSVKSKQSNLSSKPQRQSSMKLVNITYVDVSRESYDPLGIIRDEVQRAIREGKTFTVQGNFPGIRRALTRRGWIEKIHYLCYRLRFNEKLKEFQHHSIIELVNLIRVRELSDICKRLIKSKLLANHQVDFYWAYNCDCFRECPDKVKMTKINKFRRAGFSYTSKQGLCNAFQKSYFPRTPGASKMNHPRTYSLSRNGDTPNFINDFHITASMSLLKWVVNNSIAQNCKVISPEGKIPLSVFDFAVNECLKFIKKTIYENFQDDIIEEAFEHEWANYLENFYKAAHMGGHFKDVGTVTEQDMVRRSNYILSKLKEVWPYLDIDGIMNIWILKPANGSQGVGIHICRTLKYILDVVKLNPNRRYIIQKYIERPFLIYNTKFDIRQWFLISSSVPLTIWMYKQCYLRFSSKIYNLRKLHESIHLTNNSVQCRYTKKHRNNALPTYNMWNSSQFKNHLSDLGFPKVFDDIIYPGMRECIIASILMLQDTLDRRTNCFELYGADFILTEDFKPWLLEINGNPALHASTPITAKMCPMVVEDVIRVVIDYEKNKGASTGEFEIIYQEFNSVSGKATPVVGTSFQPEYCHSPLANKTNNFKDKKIIASNLNDIIDLGAVNCIKETGKVIKKILEDLMQLLNKRQQRGQEKINTCNAIVPYNYYTNNMIRPEHSVPAILSSTGNCINCNHQLGMMQ
ncbi:hypothetical protein NQ314_015652 [Rhamnusium bicolor]|uniref:Tubulin glycylase 3A n=1 Tax=Rhamnusium bicolor TaxID=1586634 RepID=A0AAV8WXS9_9CUCU|nr:hypothetical protein NQ314_015652 [Rhamnusium bicolor]